MAKLLGRADIVVDGQTLLSGDDSTIDLGGYSRPDVTGTQVYGYREEIKPSKVEVNIAVDANFDGPAINAMVDVTVNFVADTGQTWVINGAWCSEPVTIAAKDGKAKAVFMGPPAQQITAA